MAGWMREGGLRCTESARETRTCLMNRGWQLLRLGSNFLFARNTSRIDAKRADHFIQADLSVPNLHRPINRKNRERWLTKSASLFARRHRRHLLPVTAEQEGVLAAR